MRKANARGRAAAAVSGALLLGLSCQAGAATVVYQNTGFVYGDTVSYFTDQFTINDPGTYQATLTDFNFPAPLDQLGVIVTTDGTQEVARLDQPGLSAPFNVASPGTYDVNLYGLAGDTLKLGLYGVNVALSASPAPVVLPPAVVLLGSAMLALGVAGRRRIGWGGEQAPA